MSNTKHVVITGCAQGIGLAIAEEFSKNGWHVIGIDIASLTNVSAVATPLQVDVSDAVEVENALKGIPQFNCLINNAAIQIEKPLWETSIEEWNRVINVNLSAAFYLTKTCYSRLKKGSIVNISSVHARATSFGISSYAASKGGITALTRAAALELAPFGIRVNSILPGAVNSSMLQSSLKRFSDSKQALDRLISATPMGRIGHPTDVAKLAFFLSDPEVSGNITGQEFVCDGGVLARLASES